jgi:hypothetical protein
LLKIVGGLGGFLLKLLHFLAYRFRRQLGEHAVFPCS